MKLKTELKKRHEGETYIFKNGVATVPGMRHKSGKPYTITLKEFKEITECLKT